MVTVMHYTSTRMEYNQEAQRATHFIVDETQVVSRKGTSAEQLNTAVATFRKYGGICTMAMQNITAALESVGLGPCVGYLHTDRPGRASLSLDLIEELRPVVADRFVLSLINKKIVTGKDFKQKENGAVLMDDDCRKKLITEWQKKKKEVITHPFLNEKIEWGMVPYAQAMLLARYLRGDLDSYPTFLWK